MSATRPAEILRQLEQTGGADAELLARFVATKDAAAFAELVRRHGPLVFGVCRRVTGHRQDAEDAFQATFLVLAKKAATLANPALVGNWLYGVAFRVAWRAKRAARRRRAREVQVPTLPEPHAPRPISAMPELMPILDEELAALPAHYRDAVVLCDLRGASRAEAAAALGVPEGTLSSRLANGRKKLAARLTKRGVALSAAALPLALSEAQAATTLPTDLVTKTCGLVAEYAASGAVPGALAQLTKGGFAMRKALVFSVLMGAAVAGAVFAARPNDTPPVDPPKPPVVAEKPEAVAQPKAEPKPGDKPAFTGNPKLQRTFELPFSRSATLMWNAAGTHLAVRGLEPVEPAEANKTQTVVWLLALDATSSKLLSAITNPRASLVAVAPDGAGIVTDLREYNLISGHHRLHYWGVRPPGPGGGPHSGLIAQRIVNLDSTETRGYAFVDGATYRTVAWHRDSSGAPSKIDVVEVDATTGKLGKSFLKLDYGLYVLAPNGKRLAVLDKDVTAVTVYDVDRGVKVSEYNFPVDKAEKPPTPLGGFGGPSDDSLQPFLTFSPDGSRLVVSRGYKRTTVLNADTGTALPELDGVATVSMFSDVSTFTGDGRLLALKCQTYKVDTRPKRGFDGEGRTVPGDVVLTVWDTQTGKTLKSWKSTSGVQVAFNPARPLLAILEPNGKSETRVGFWDFAAEVEKK